MRSPLSLPGVRLVAGAVRASYRRKLAVALLVVLLTSSVAAVGLYVQIGTLLDRSVEQSMTAAASAESDELTEWTSQNRLVARLLSEHPVYGTGDDAAVRDHLRSRRGELRETEVVDAYLIDRRNLTVEISARRELEGTAVGDLPWEEEFAFTTFDDVRISRPHETANGTIVLGFITPVRQQPGHLLVVTVDASSVFERFEHPVEGGFTRVVDSNGTVVFADDRSAMLRQYQERTLRAPVVSMGVRGESGFVDDPTFDSSTPGRDDHVVAFAPVAGTDWVVVEHAPTDEAYAIRREARTWVGITGVAAVAGFLGVVLVLGADVTGSLSRLSGRAERIEDGVYGVDFETERPDEFGDLNRTLARTRDTLRRRFEELRETRDELEASNRALEERSTMVNVLNRVLRHNVRNEVNVIAGRAEYLAGRLDRVDGHDDALDSGRDGDALDVERLRAELDVIERRAMALAEISERTQRIKHVLSGETTELTPVELTERLDERLDAVSSAEPETTVTLTVADDAEVVAQAVATLPEAVADVVEEIIAHNDGDVTVDVTVSARTPADGVARDSLVVTIDDDGGGLPDIDVQAIVNGDESPLEHGGGLALWCLEWTVNEADGELVVDADGTTAEVRLPPADPNVKPTQATDPSDGTTQGGS